MATMRVAVTGPAPISHGSWIF